MNRTFVVDPQRVAAYIRWSTEEQGEGTTLEVQREACRHYILARGWDWREDLVFVDDGFSGATLDRPGLAALRQDVQAGRVTCVVVFKLDRLSRNVVDTVNLVLAEWDGLCYVQSTREPIDTTDPSSRMFFYVLSSYAEWERNVIRDRTLSGKVKRAQQGKNPGFTPPFGYRPGARPGEWVIDGREAAIVRRCFQAYARGQGYREIVRTLDAEGLSPRSAGRWHPQTVAGMLANPAYIGRLEYGKTVLAPRRAGRSGGARRVPVAEPRYACVEGVFPPIIDRSLWDTVQRLREHRGAHCRGRAHTARYLLSGLAFCRCGGRLAGHFNRERQRRYYRCPGQGRDWPGCDAALIDADPAEAAILAAVRRLFARATAGAAARAVERQLRQEAAQAAELAAVRQAGLLDLARRRQRLDQAFDAAALPAAIYARRLAGIEAEEGRLQAAIAAARGRVGRLRHAGARADDCAKLARQVDLWERLSPAECRQLLYHAVARLVIYRRSARRGVRRDAESSERRAAKRAASSGARRTGPFAARGTAGGGRNPHPIEIDLSLRRLTTAGPGPAATDAPGIRGHTVETPKQRPDGLPRPRRLRKERLSCAYRIRS